MKKNPLTLDDHKAYAKLLHETRNSLTSVFTKLANQLPLKAPELRQLQNALDAIDSVRFDLENRMFAACGTQDTNIYYPGSPSRINNLNEQNELNR